MDKKQDIRKEVLKKRSEMSQKEWEEKSRKIAEKVIAHPFFLECEELYCYVDYRGEVSTRLLIEQAWTSGKKVAVPKVTGSEMNFFYIHSWNDLEKGYCGILEPRTAQLATGHHVLVVMPGAVFDLNRNRIGYGKGFYDRFLARYPIYKRIAVAFQLQIAEQIPNDDFDIRPELIFTEEMTYV